MTRRYSTLKYYVVTQSMVIGTIGFNSGVVKAGDVLKVTSSMGRNLEHHEQAQVLGTYVSRETMVSPLVQDK